MKQPEKGVIAIFMIAILFSISIGKSNSQVTDKDGKVYKTVIIGTQEWMAEDLEVKHYRNGDPVKLIACDNEASLDPPKYAVLWDTTKTGAYCVAAKPYRDCYVNDGRNSCILYNWYAVNDTRGLAPEGWHIPSNTEWETLVGYLGGGGKAGVKLKSKSGWDSKYSKNGNNECGFNALPNGSRENGFHMGFCQYAYFWTSTAGGNSTASYWQLGYQGENSAALSNGSNFWNTGMGVRCVKD